jgi:hypothetical protein
MSVTVRDMCDLSLAYTRMKSRKIASRCFGTMLNLIIPVPKIQSQAKISGVDSRSTVMNRPGSTFSRNASVPIQTRLSGTGLS